MNYFDAIILGIVEGLTEFLPVSSTGHLTIAEQLLGLEVDDPAVTGFTAVIQMGAIVAVIVYFARDIRNIIRTWALGLVKPEYRGHRDFRMGWYVIVGTIPVGIVGLLFRDVIKNDLRSLWVVAFALIGWSAVMWAAERAATQDRSEKRLNLTDAVVVGLVQCFSLIPGVSRSGATISAGLFRGLDRVTATRLSFFLSIPALLAAGIFELKDALGGDIPVGVTLVGTAVSFVVAYATVAWLLRFVAHHPITWFVPYRVALGTILHRPAGQRGRVGHLTLVAGPSQPAGPLEPDPEDQAQTGHQGDGEGVAVGPRELGHVVEVHAVDPGDQRRYDDDARRRPRSCACPRSAGPRSAPGGRRTPWRGAGPARRRSRRRG